MSGISDLDRTTFLLLWYICRATRFSSKVRWLTNLYLVHLLLLSFFRPWYLVKLIDLGTEGDAWRALQFRRPFQNEALKCCLSCAVVGAQAWVLLISGHDRFMRYDNYPPTNKCCSYRIIVWKSFKFQLFDLLRISFHCEQYPEKYRPYTNDNVKDFFMKKNRVKFIFDRARLRWTGCDCA